MNTLPTWTVIDTITDETLTGTTDEIEAALPAWFPDAPAEVTEAIGQLADALRRGDYRGDLEVFLAVRVEQVPLQPKALTFTLQFNPLAFPPEQWDRITHVTDADTESGEACVAYWAEGLVLRVEQDGDHYLWSTAQLSPTGEVLGDGCGGTAAQACRAILAFNHAQW